MIQIKGRGTVIMDKYQVEKCLALLNTNQFVKLERDPTEQIDTKIQGVLRKIKTNISLQEYSSFYLTGSSPAKTMNLQKYIHKSLPTDNIEKLLTRPIVSDMKTPTQLVKYLAKLLSPLSQSDCTVNGTKHFIEQIKYDKIPEGYQMMSFDFKSLFASFHFR